MTLTASQSLSAAAVRIVDTKGERIGQGLAVPLADGRVFILTCHHVIARCPNLEQIPVVLFDAFDNPVRKILAAFEPQRSDPQRDLAVLRPLEALRLEPVRLARLGDSFDGLQPVIGITRPGDDAQRLNATLAAPTRLELNDPLFRGIIPQAFRLTASTDVRPGISGSPIASSGSVLGLAHFSRGETSDFTREAYVVPIKAWFRLNPELEAISRPFVDPVLAQGAIVKVGGDLDPVTDFGLVGYREDRILERPEEAQAEKALNAYRRCLIRGRHGSGKTWIAYRLARKKAGVVVIPRLEAPPERFDKSALFENGLLLLVDGAEGQENNFSFNGWYRALSTNDGALAPSLLVTSRDDRDWLNVRQRFRDLANLFDDRQPKAFVFTSATTEGGRDIDPQSARVFVERNDLPAAAFSRFDGTIGSLISPTDAMKERYRSLQEIRFGNAAGSLLLDSLKVLLLLHLSLTESLTRKVAAVALSEEPSDFVWRELKRLTQEAGFGFFDEAGFFRGYKVYIEQCVTYAPSMNDFTRFVQALPGQDGEAPLIFVGIKLLEYDDERGFEFLEAAAAKGSQIAVQAGLLAASEDPGFLKSSIRITHQFLRSGDTTFLPLLGVLYRRWKKPHWAIRAYRAALDGGDVHVEEALGALLIKDAVTRDEGKARLRRAVAHDPSGMAAIVLAANMIDEIGSESEVVALLRQSNAGSTPLARLLLGSLYSAWPGHWKQATDLLEPIAEDKDSEVSRSLAFFACEVLQQAATIAGNASDLQRWSDEQETLRGISSVVSSVFRSTSDPTTSPRGEQPQSSQNAPHARFSDIQFPRLTVPSLQRFEILETGWERAWTPDESNLSALMEEFSAYERAGYAQAGLITAIGLYRKGEFQVALDKIRAVLKLWNSSDRFDFDGKLLLASILADCDRIDEIPELIEGAVDSLSGSSLLPQPAPGIAHAAARNLRRRSRSDGDGKRFAAIVHHYLSVLWVSFEEWGVAWFENRKWLAFMEEDFGDRALDVAAARQSNVPAQHIEEYQAVVEALRSARQAEVKIAGIPGLTLFLRPDGDRVFLSGKGPGLVRDESEAAYHQAALMLSKLGLELDWNPGGTLHFRSVVPFGGLAGDASATEQVLSDFVASLETTRRLSESGSGSTEFQIFDDGEHSDIDFQFGAIDPGTAIKDLEQELETDPGSNPLLRAEMHYRLAGNYLALKEGSRRDNIAAAIDACHEALLLMIREDHPWQWADVQERLGRAYLEMASFTAETATEALACFDLALGIHKRSVNELRWALLMICRGQALRSVPRAKMRLAIESFQAGLEVLNEVEHCGDWAWAQEQLGRAHLAHGCALISSGKPKGSKHLSTAQTCFEAALRVNTRLSSPYRWAALHNALADCYLEETGDRRELTARAIVVLNSALEVFTESEHRWDWAVTQATLCAAYLRQCEWLSESVSEVAPRAEAALRVITREADPERWATLQFNLGSVYTRLPGANTKDLLERAMQHYREVVSVASRFQHDPASKAALARAMGLAYQAHGAYDNCSVAQAIRHFEEALAFYQQHAFPAMWLELNAAISAAYLNLQSGSRASNLEKALYHATLCQKAAPRDKFPYAWAFNEERLAWIHLARYEFAPRDLSKAFQSVQAALQVFSRTENEFRWAVNQDFLGRCFSSSQGGRRLENIEAAIRHFKSSLEVFTSEQHPDDRVEVLELLVYEFLASAIEYGQERVEAAIQSARDGLRLVSKGTNRRMWGVMQNALGVAFCYLESPAPGANIANGIAHQMLALDSFPKEEFPVSYAIVQMHLGFSHLAQADVSLFDDIRDLALHNFEVAAGILTREQAPRRWALIQNGMGCASRRREDSLESAVAFHRSALQVLTPAAFPEDHARVHLDLARTYLHFKVADRPAREEVTRSFDAALTFFNKSGFPRKHEEIEETMRAADWLQAVVPGALSADEG